MSWLARSTSFAVFLVIACASTASAQHLALGGPATEPPLQRDAPPAQQQPSGYDGTYGGLLVGAYLAAPLLGAALVFVHPAVGVATYFLSVPAIHVAHDNPLAAMLAILGPTTAAMSGMLLMSALQRNCDGGVVSGCFGPIVTAGIVGYAAYAVVDILVHARHGRMRLTPRAPSITTRVSYRR